MTIAPAPPVPRFAASEPALRETGIDFVRALCVLGVVILHSIMVGVAVTEDGPLFENASDGTAWIVPVSWLLQVMPLFFVIGGFSGLIAYRRSRIRGGTALAFISGRVQRLLRPAVVTVAIIGAALAALSVAGVPADLVATAGFRYGQPLWFLAVFLLCQALLPALAAAHDRAPLRTIGLLALAAASVDALRASTGMDGVGFLNLAFVWLTLQQLGFFFADGRIDALSRRTRLVAGAGAAMLLAASFLLGVHSPDLIANINPPTTALLLVGIVHTCALSLLRDRLGRASRRPAPAAFTGFVTARAMTIYLWHMPVLLAMAGACAVFALVTGHPLPALDSTGWWASRPLWLAAALALTAAVAVAFTRFETGRPRQATGSWRRLALGVLSGLLGILLLLVAGTSVATAAATVALLLVSLSLTRRPAPARSVTVGAARG